MLKFHSAKVSFGESDVIQTDPIDVQPYSVTWRWKETQNITTQVAPYIGYVIMFSKDNRTWHRSSEIGFVVSEDGWQEGTVTGLEPDTQYWFDIVVYRKYSDGKLYMSPDTAQTVDNVGLLTARTLAG